MRINLKNKYKQEGSILILTMLSLVGALSIAIAMSSISIMERKMTTKSRKSVTAFQSANSGIEWAMKKINDASVDNGKVQKISDVFTIDTNTGKISCGGDAMFGIDSNMDCEIYLLGGTNQNRTIITTPDTTLDKVVAIRSTGKYGKDEEQVGRSLEAYAMPNCAASEERVGDFCVGTKLYQDDSWTEAVKSCAEAGKRLCTAAELIATSEMNLSMTNDIGDKDEWAADVVDSSNSIYIDSSQEVQSGPGPYEFRCCRNR